MRKIIKISLIILFWLGVWEIASLIVNLPMLFPSPITVIKRLFGLVLEWDFYKSILISLFHVLFGIIVAVFFGIILAIVSALFGTVYSLVSPFLTVIKSTPVVAFIFLINVFIGDEKTVVIICSLMVLPIVFANVYQGIKSVDVSLLEASKVFKIPFKKLIWALYIPSTLPYFLSALLSAIGLAWKAGVAAEVLCNPKNSIGTNISSANQYFDNTEIFAWTVVIIIFSLLFEFLFTKLIKILFKRQLKLGGSDGNKKFN
jgi:NitT/TauT family transport system permease protein